VLIRQTCAKQGIRRDQLTIHADRGSSMTSKPVTFLLADPGITQSHSRPHVSNDNPFSDYAEGVVMPSAGRGARVRAGWGAAAA
jgi:transposase InsO family protein